jgi:hypothetical protein
MANYVTLVNQLLTRLNEVTLATTGSGFDDVRNVQALAKQAINNSIRNILQTGQEWPFLKTTYTQTLTAGTRQYDFPADFATVDWDTFYIKELGSASNTPSYLPTISFEEYTQRYRGIDDQSDSGSGVSAPQRVYQTYESKFGVTPVPNDAYEIEYVYWTFPADLSAYDDTAVIPDRFNHVIIDGAMMYMMRFRSNDQSAALHQQSLQEGIRSMRRILMDDPLDIRSTVIQRNKSFSNTMSTIV